MAQVEVKVQCEYKIMYNTDDWPNYFNGDYKDLIDFIDPSTDEINPTMLVMKMLEIDIEEFGPTGLPGEFNEESIVTDKSFTVINDSPTEKFWEDD